MLPIVAGKSDGSVSVLGIAGLLPGDEHFYRIFLRASGASRDRLGEVTGLSQDALAVVLDRFAKAGLVQVSGHMVAAAPPTEALGKVISEKTEQLHRENEQVDALRNLLPTLVADHSSVARHSGDSVDVRAMQDGDIVALIRRLAVESTGDLMWFRPDQWRLPVAHDIDALVLELMASGRRSRAIYPARAIEEAPKMLRARAEAGERIRIVASISTRIAIMGSSAALIPDRWGIDTGRRLVVREHSLVRALATLFDNVWEHAMTVPGLDGELEDPGGQRRLLLQQLTRGVKDEQIARALGVSLRTVRRRIADIMDELGAASRFQAGVEAVRRGWV